MNHKILFPSLNLHTKFEYSLIAIIASSIMWSLDPLLYITFPKSYNVDLLSSLALFRSAYAFVIGFSILFPTTHRFLVHNFEKYRDIESSQKKIVVLHHFVEFLALSIIFPIFTYYMVRTFLQSHDIEIMRSNLISLAELCIVIMMMYCMELASRIENVRPMVVCHHLLATTDGLLVFIFPSTVMIKTAIMLVYFVTFEAIVFLGLFMYRVCPQRKITARVIRIGMSIFAVTRPLQLLLVVAPIIASWEDQNFVKWHAIMQIMITLILTVMQLWSLKIHFGILKRCTDQNSSWKQSKAECNC